MTSNRDKLRQVIELSKLLNNSVWENDSHISGEISIDKYALDLLTAISDFDEDLVIYKNKIKTRPAKLSSGDLVNVYLHYPRYPKAFFAKSFEDFLPNYNFKYKQPPIFYIADKQLLIEKEHKYDDPLIASYQAVLELIDLIESSEISDHHSSDPEPYFLFLGHEKKIRLSIEYSVQNLLNAGEVIRTSVEKLKHFIENGAHQGDRRLIFKKTIIEVLAPQGELSGFSFLVENLSDFVNRLFGNFELYLGKYTFDSERQKLLVEIRDYFRSINDAISSAQLRLVAIPLSLLIAIDKIEPATEKANTLSNVAVLLGVFIFSILMGRLTYSQRETLISEKYEIYSRRKQISDKYNELYKELKIQFSRLDNRISCQQSTLKIIDGSIILVSILSIYAFFYNNTHSILSQKVLFWILS